MTFIKPNLKNLGHPTIRFGCLISGISSKYSRGELRSPAAFDTSENKKGRQECRPNGLRIKEGRDKSRPYKCFLLSLSEYKWYC
jgi:hypothetical protein